MVGMQSGTATVEDSLVVSYKTKHSAHMKYFYNLIFSYTSIKQIEKLSTLLPYAT